MGLTAVVSQFLSRSEDTDFVPPRASDVVTVRGELDIETIAEFTAALNAAIDQSSSGHVCVDLSSVTFLGAAGVNALNEVRHYAEQRSSTLILVNPSAAVSRTLRLAGQQGRFPANRSTAHNQ